jgi:hypothetical protein
MTSDWIRNCDDAMAYANAARNLLTSPAEQAL